MAINIVEYKGVAKSVKDAVFAKSVFVKDDKRGAVKLLARYLDMVDFMKGKRDRSILNGIEFLYEEFAEYVWLKITQLELFLRKFVRGDFGMSGKTINAQIVLQAFKEYLEWESAEIERINKHPNRNNFNKGEPVPEWFVRATEQMRRRRIMRFQNKRRDPDTLKEFCDLNGIDYNRVSKGVFEWICRRSNERYTDDELRWLAKFKEVELLARLNKRRREKKG